MDGLQWKTLLKMDDRYLFQGFVRVTFPATSLADTSAAIISLSSSETWIDTKCCDDAIEK